MQATDFLVFGAVVPFVPTRSSMIVTQYFDRNVFHSVCCIMCTAPPHIPSCQFSYQGEILVLYYIWINTVHWLRWSRGSVLAFGTQVRGFKPGRSRPIFKGEKILSTPSFGGEVKPSVPCRRFPACKKRLELCGSRILGEICRNISRPRRVPPSAARGLSRHWT